MKYIHIPVNKNITHKLGITLLLLSLGACSSTNPYTSSTTTPNSRSSTPVDSRQQNPANNNNTQSNNHASDRNNSANQERVNSVLMSALNQIGTPYRYGGSDPSGFDCSGLVQYTHASAGITVPRSTREQMNFFRNISKSELQAGDLAFFQTGNNQYHVAIMLNQNEFVHAPSSGKTVSTSSFSNPYWKANFIKAGRLN